MEATINTYDEVVDGWERSETNSGVPYYISHKLERTTWDHPYLSRIMDDLDIYSSVKYVAYRTAFKIRHLQKKMKLHHMPNATLKEVFSNYGYTEGCADVIGCSELHDLLTDLYLRLDQGTTLDSDQAEIHAEVLQNLLLNLFDVKRTGYVRVLSVKLILILLCAGRLADKYKAFYHEIHDPSTYISTKNFTAFLEDIIQLPMLLQEGRAFGSNVSPAVSSCLQMSNTLSSVGISEDVFYSWLLREPQIVVWIPTFHRAAGAETVKHEAKCNVCKTYPIIGFRYKCLQCFNFDLCQSCYFSGRVKKNHKLKHPIQEYCMKTSAKEDAKMFFKIVRNNLSKKHRHKAQKKCQFTITESQNCQYVSRGDPPEIDIHANLTENAERIAELEAHAKQLQLEQSVHSSDKENNSSTEDKENNSQIDQLKQQRHELEEIIRKLEDENKKLYHELKQIREPSDTESNLSGGNPTDYSSVPVERNNFFKISITSQKKSPLAPLDNNFSLNTQKYMLDPKNSRNISGIAHDYTPSHMSTILSGTQPTFSFSSSVSPKSCDPTNTSFTSSVSPQSCNPTQRSSSSSVSPQSFGPVQRSFISYRSGQRSQSISSYGDQSDFSRTTNRSAMSISRRGNSSDPQTFCGASYRQERGNNTTNNFHPRAGRSEFDSLDNLDISPSHFTLPSFANSRDFLDEEEQMDSMVNKMVQIFPSNLSYSAYSMASAGLGNEHEEMLRATSSITSEFVAETIQPYFQD